MAEARVEQRRQVRNMSGTVGIRTQVSKDLVDPPVPWRRLVLKGASNSMAAIGDG
jgi:hypothetical protein